MFFSSKQTGGSMLIAALWLLLSAPTPAQTNQRIHFPPPGEGLDKQQLRQPEAVGLKPAVIAQLKGTATRWALWRNGHLIHVEGAFNHKEDVYSLRKTWHALAVGAAIKQRRIPSLNQPISVWEKDLTGNDALATWRHVLTQSAGFDYPYGQHPDYQPGEMWTYSDHNLRRLTGALAKVYGKRHLYDRYDEVLKAAYFDAIGMRGWFTSKHAEDDGPRLNLDLEDMGRLGLLVLARGQWQGKEIIPRWFVEQLETKQTGGMKVNYDGPNDGRPSLLYGHEDKFPEAPYGYLTWVNTDGDVYPRADRAWAWGAGRGGHAVFWNHKLGIVFVCHGRKPEAVIPEIIEANLADRNPLADATHAAADVVAQTIYFPPPGEGFDQQSLRKPEAAGINPALVEKLKGKGARWALWRHGHLIHVEGDFNYVQHVASLRKTWHALAVGAAIKQGRIPSLEQKLSVYETDLQGNDALATWRHVLTQSAGFDYPYGDYPDYKPGEMWTYSDANPLRLTDALAKVYGKKNHRDNYAAVLNRAYFDQIGMRGWRVSARADGAILDLDLEDMGRLGLLVLARGRWARQEVIPQWFVEQLETKQTRGMKVNYNGPNDGRPTMLFGQEARYREAPYGFLTWVNTDGDVYPKADRAWAWGAGAGGHAVFWNHKLGIVFAVHGRDDDFPFPEIIEAHITGQNPLLKTPVKSPVRSVAARQVGRWDRFEMAVSNNRRYADAYRDVTLDVTYTKPDGAKVSFWGFYDGGQTWKLRFLPDQLGRWKYAAKFSDDAASVNGEFECVRSDLPGLIGQDEINPQWFGFRGGNHILIRSFHAGDRFFARNWSDDARRAFLDWAQAQGYNTLSIASHYLNRDAEGRGRGWETPALWPLNAAEYQRMERVLDDLARRRFIVFPFAGFLGRLSNFPREAQEQELYLRYTLARLGAYWNVLLNVGGPEPMLKGQPYLTAAEINRVGQLVRRLDVFGHLLTVHTPTGDSPFRDEGWLSYVTLQGPKTFDQSELSAGLLRNHHPQKPLYAQETLWSGNYTVTRRHGRDYTDDDLRKNAYVITMSATALNFADNRGDSSTGFSGTLKLEDRAEARHDIVKRVWDYFETVPFYRLSPRQDLVTNGFCLAEEGKEYLVYLPTGGAVSVKVGPGAYAVEWVNARDTKDRRPGGLTETGAQLAAPDGDDWLLRLTVIPPKQLADRRSKEAK